jgi:hypothetical protein
MGPAISRIALLNGFPLYLIANDAGVEGQNAALADVPAQLVVH